MVTVGLSSSRLKLCAFIMAFLTPMAGALMLMVSLIKSILYLSPKTDFVIINFNSLILCSIVGVFLIIGGFLLLIGLIQENARWIFVYLILSTPSLVYLLAEALFVAFLGWHFKIIMILFTILMLCVQICVLGFFICLIRRKRTESMENLIVFYEDGYFSSAVSRENSFDSFSL